MLAKDFRLTLRSDFYKLKSRGDFYKSENFSIVFIKNSDLETPKFGVIVSKKVSPKSPIRNRIKRRIRRLIFENLLDLKGFFLFFPKESVKLLPYSLLELEISKFKNFFQGYNSKHVK
jgi:ribonuclease P protein component